MKILGFRSKRLNGYLNFELAFNPEISFLIGINGSGKTSVIKAIMALLAPDIDWLFTTEFEFLEVSFEENRRHYSISAKNGHDRIEIALVEDGKVERRDEMSREIYRSLRRAGDERRYSHDGEVVLFNNYSAILPSNFPTIKVISEFPSPIFLGLDRTTLGPDDRRRGEARAGAKRAHLTIRTFLDESVSQAESLASGALGQANTSRIRLANQLREDILLSLFADVEDTEITKLPNKGDIHKYETYQRSIRTAYSVLGIGTPRIDEIIEPYFKALISNARGLQSYNKMTDVFGPQAKKEAIQAFTQWLRRAQRLPILANIEDMIRVFNNREAKLFENARNYIELMNEFLTDSNKELFIRDTMQLGLRLPSAIDGDMYYLSSGERQLFVLITTLMFNRDSRQANVLIIDEPELSLHIKWQEMFVDALLRANSNVQLIMATHSPSIIFHREQQCIDLHD